ncbi:MAG: phosphate/phosphite/phosphonate ABC transporter substrate-binding protein, partial [Alphaproteobacteria bacterium]
GYPLTHELAGRVRLIATPRYDAEGCVGPNYSSMVVVAAADPVTDIAELRGKRCAINSYGSQSGCNALRTLLAPVAGSRGFFSEVLVSGGHPFSLEMIQRGQADVAAIDCVTHGLFAAHAPHRLEGTRVLCRTASTPALPFISARATRPDDVARLRDGLCAAVADAGLAETRAALLIADVEVLSLDAYDCIPRMVQAALDTGFTDLSPPDA